MQMIADYLDEREQKYIVYRPGETPQLTKCLLYCGQQTLCKDTLYIISEGMEAGFPADRFSYITSTALKGEAAHIRDVQCTFPELVNAVMEVFAHYAGFERELCNVISSGGSLSDLCSVAGRYLHNPVYIHDSMFCVIGQSSCPEGMFEFSEKTKKNHIPLWLINEVEFDRVYKQTLTNRQAGVLGNELSFSNERSLYVNLWEEKEYLGRLLILELESAFKPGQLRASEFFAGYVTLWLKNQAMSKNHARYSYEQTFINLLERGETDLRELKMVLNALGWKAEDKYLCMKLQQQDTADTVRSDLVVNSRLSSVIGGQISFRYQQKLCVIVNLTRSDMDPGELRLRLAPMIRDSCLYAGIANPIEGIHDLRRGFVQADIALEYITEVDSSEWIVPFSFCALNYIQESACQKLPAKTVAHPILLELREHDRLQGTQYYETLRVYLNCERSIPATAAALIIHRTTLTYRLGKIMELTRLNLDNAELRLYLQLSYRLLELDGRV